MLREAREGTARVAPRGGWLAAGLVQLLLATLLLRLLWLDQPPGALIFDEVYYVNAARVLLGWPLPAGAPYAQAAPGLDPNSEHFPLAKLAIAGSMQLLGDNAYGWRLPSVLLGTGAVALLFLLVRRLSGRAELALLAAFLFSFDNLVFVHGRIATLDIFMLAPMLLGLYLYLAKRPALAGAALALGALAKITGVYGLGVLLGYEALRLLLAGGGRAARRATAANLLVLGGSFAVVFLGLLWPLDLAWTSFADPAYHLAHVLGYGVALTAHDYPSSIASAPWQWLVNQVPIHYLTVSGDGAAPPLVDFVGMMNPYVLAPLPVAVAFLVIRTRGASRELPLFLCAWLAATYLPSLVAVLMLNRASYIFYFLPVLPALSTAVAYLLLDAGWPRALALVYAAAVLFGFTLLFPFKTI
ncbi:MAG: phospholipid carrier-dependent glycosyltransferase [Chloroflexota bacterium]